MPNDNKKLLKEIQQQPPSVDLSDLKILANPWDNVYWFARMLISSDKYGGIGAESKIMLTLAAGIREIAKTEKDEVTAVDLAMNYIRQVLYDRWHRTKRIGQVEKLVEDLAEKLLTFADLEVFVVTCERVLLTINESLRVIPNDDKFLLTHTLRHYYKRKVNTDWLR